MRLSGEGSGGSHDAPDEMNGDLDSTRGDRRQFTVGVQVRAPAWRRNCSDVEAIIRDAALAALGACAADLVAPDGIEVCLVLADDAAVRALNRDFRGRDAPTNVLAFPLQEAPNGGGPGPLLLGDVVLAYSTVRREAAAQDKSLADHARHLVVHGILHLLGHVHDTAAAAADMERRERAVLAGLGIADPYADRTTALAASGGRRP